MYVSCHCFTLVISSYPPFILSFCMRNTCTFALCTSLAPFSSFSPLDFTLVYSIPTSTFFFHLHSSPCSGPTSTLLGRKHSAPPFDQRNFSCNGEGKITVQSNLFRIVGPYLLHSGSPSPLLSVSSWFLLSNSSMYQDQSM